MVYLYIDTALRGERTYVGVGNAVDAISLIINSRIRTQLALSKYRSASCRLVSSQSGNKMIVPSPESKAESAISWSRQWRYQLSDTMYHRPD